MSERVKIRLGAISEAWRELSLAIRCSIAVFTLALGVLIIVAGVNYDFHAPNHDLVFITCLFVSIALFCAFILVAFDICRHEIHARVEFV